MMHLEWNRCPHSSIVCACSAERDSMHTTHTSSSPSSAIATGVDGGVLTNESDDAEIVRFFSMCTLAKTCPRGVLGGSRVDGVRDVVRVRDAALVLIVVAIVGQRTDDTLV